MELYVLDVLVAMFLLESIVQLAHNMIQTVQDVLLLVLCHHLLNVINVLQDTI